VYGAVPPLTAPTDCKYAVLIAASGRGFVSVSTSDGIADCTSNSDDPVAVVAGTLESLTDTEKVFAPAVVKVVDKTPPVMVAASAQLLLVMVQVYGAVPPLTDPTDCE
jgi:hypothetical protein